MEDLIALFPQQLSDAIELGQRSPLNASTTPIHNVIITGLGGSGIGGRLVKSLSNPRVPVDVVNDYDLPSYANENTLVVVSSYSGNTEETLSAMNQAIDKGCQITAITSGGRVKELCDEHQLQFIEIPGGNPPRSQLGFSLVQQFFVLHAFGMIDDHTAELQASVQLLEEGQEAIKELARTITSDLVGSMPVIYCSSSSEPIAIRWRQQINENSKMLCWHHVLPEMNHNELVGWEKVPNDVSLILLRDSDEHERTSARFKICSDIFSRARSVNEIWPEGNSRIERAFYHIHLGDWVSLYLANENQVDPIDIKNIDYLKNALSEI